MKKNPTLLACAKIMDTVIMSGLLSPRHDWLKVEEVFFVCVCVWSSMAASPLDGPIQTHTLNMLLYLTVETCKYFEELKVELRI